MDFFRQTANNSLLEVWITKPTGIVGQVTAVTPLENFGYQYRCCSAFIGQWVTISAINNLSFSPDGGTIAVAAPSGQITGSMPQTELSKNAKAILLLRIQVKLSPDGKTLATSAQR